MGLWAALESTLVGHATEYTVSLGEKETVVGQVVKSARQMTLSLELLEIKAGSGSSSSLGQLKKNGLMLKEGIIGKDRGGMRLINL